MASLAILAVGCSALFPLEGLDGTGEGGRGGSGGMPPAVPCATGLIVGDCGAGQKCTLDNPGQGIPGGMSCGPAGDVVAWAPCSSDADCADGLWCEGGAGVCKPWCADASTCPDQAACITARRRDGTAVAGLFVCTAHCRLDAPSARCAPGVNCVLRDIDVGGGPFSEGDCAASGGKSAGCLCQTSADCDPGLRCDPNDLQCRAWCDANGTCAGGGQCSSALTVYDGTGFGQCAATMCFNN